MRKEYPHLDIRALAQEAGVSRTTIYNRLNRGWPIDKVKLPRQVPGQTPGEERPRTAATRHEYFAFGKPVREWAKELGWRAETVYGRIKRGMSPEQAVTTPLAARRAAGDQRTAEVRLFLRPQEWRLFRRMAAERGVSTSVLFEIWIQEREAAREALRRRSRSATASPR